MGFCSDATVRKSVVEFIQAVGSNFSSIFTRFRDIADFVLQHALFFTPPLVSPKISPCSRGSRWIAFGYKDSQSEGVELIVRAVSF